jgi:hypothetical protein
MSIKTLRKRIALVAVSALGVGLLSVAPASAANEADITAGTLPSIGVVTALAGSSANTADTDITATIVSTGKLSINVAAGTAATNVTVSGGVFTGATSGVASYSAAMTTVTSSNTTAIASLMVSPNAGVNRMIIKSYNGSVAVANLIDTATITVTAAANVGVLSASDSFAQVVNGAASAEVTTNADVAAGLRVANGSEGEIAFTIHDGTDTAMSTSTVVSATATGGAVVSFSSGTQTGAAVSTTYSSNDYMNIYVAQGTADAAINTTVTISVNGVAWISKSLQLLGDAETVGLAEYYGVHGEVNASYSSAFVFNVKDALGRILPGLSLTWTGASYNTSVSPDSATTSASTTSSTAGSFTCSAIRGSNEIQLTYKNARGTTLTSPKLKVNCVGAAYTYEASLDKAVYAPGEIATLTITAKDSTGNPASDVSTLGSDGSEVAIAGAYLTAVTAPTDVDTFTAGVKKYQYIVGSTEGSYVLAVNVPNVDSTTPYALKYSIKAPATGAVSNAEVLAAIVKLIASINKQIRALQKSLRR